MKLFIKNIIIFSLFLFTICFLPASSYYIADPYLDFVSGEDYSWKYRFQSLGDIATKKLLASSRKPNSFIFGSSRSVGAYACYLEKNIPESNFFHYANWTEPIEGMYKKLKLIDSLGINIENAIFYLDTDKTFLGSGKYHDSDHYLITGETKTNYLANHVRAFFKKLTPGKIKILLGRRLSKKEFPNWQSDLITNDCNHNCNDTSVIADYSMINNSDSYKIRVDSLVKSGFYYERPPTQQYKESQISDYEKGILLKIKQILVKHETEYEVVLTPVYDQHKFSSVDNDILIEVFEGKIFDYSGINPITNEPSNYPDLIHFQGYISKNIIDSIVNTRARNINYDAHEE
jgi:hypothetical protein